MSNQFKALDDFFPCGTARSSGEVVSITANMYQNSICKGRVSGKRKAWYVNASVNAFHLHRHLCAELRALPWFSSIPQTQQRQLKKTLACLVWLSYLTNHKTDHQYFEYAVCVDEKALFVEPGRVSISCWHVTGHDKPELMWTEVILEKVLLK